MAGFRLRLGRTLASAAIVCATAACGADPAPAPAPLALAGAAAAPRGPAAETRFLARNVIYRMDPDIALFIEQMNAEVLRKRADKPFVPGDRHDFSVRIRHGAIRMDARAMEFLMNRYVFDGPTSPVKDVRIRFAGDKLAMSGQVKKGVWVGFEMEGALAPTPDGKIRMTPTKIASMGLRVDNLMSLLGLEVAALMQSQREKGVTIDGNHVILDPARLFPPPRMAGHVVDASVHHGLLHLTLDDGQARPWPPVPVPDVRSTLLMWGGDILINKTLAVDAKMQVLDATPDTPMIFSLTHYLDSLEAGYTVSTRDGHMICYMPDLTTFGPNQGRYAPPALPVPGMADRPSDMPPGAAERLDYERRHPGQRRHAPARR